jgi:tetratricopeptide (TPR) repeat protein
MRAVAYALVCATLLASVGTDAHARRRIPAQTADTTRVALPDPVLAPDFPRAMKELEAARAAAAADRHADAIRLYKRAVKFYPPLADEIAVELGNQYTWADEPDTAMTWYQYHLSRHPDDADAQLGVARLVSWNDDLDRARRLYESLLAADSTNLDARLGHAQVVNWSGKHREAEALYRAILADHPDNVEAQAGLMQALRWMGRSDLAVDIADSTAAPQLDELATDIQHSAAPGVSYRYERNEDSDDIERHYHTVTAGFSPDLLTRISAQYDHANFEQPARPEVSRDAFSLVLERRFSATLAMHASAGREFNSFDVTSLGPQTDFDLTILDIYSTITPRDWMRIDVGVSRGSIDNPDAIFRAISRTAASAGLDYRLRSNLVWISSVDAAWYSDDNSSFGLGTRVAWDPLWRLPIDITHRFTSNTGFAYYGFDRTTDGGYYDPSQYLTFYEEVALALRFPGRVRARVAGRISVDKENFDEWFPTGRWELSASWNIWRGLGLSAGYTNSNSRLDSRPGYEIDGFYVTLDWMIW